MQILIPTTPHTGTHLLSSFFEKAGFESTPIQINDKPDNSVTTTHIDTVPRFNRVLDLMNEFQAVVPIRHPYLVAESWIRREQPIERMIATYRRLPALHEAGALFVPVDSPERDKYIQAVNDKLGVDLNPDWGTVVNGYHNTHDMTYRDVEPLPEVKQLAQEMSGFLSKFYEVEMLEEKPARKKRESKVDREDEFIEVIALVKMQNDESGEMAEAGDLIKKQRKYARIMQDAGTIKLPI